MKKILIGAMLALVACAPPAASSERSPAPVIRDEGNGVFSWCGETPGTRIYKTQEYHTGMALFVVTPNPSYRGDCQ